MNVTLNGEARTFDAEQLSLTALLEALGLGGKPVVVELDKEAVLPAAYGETIIRDGSSLEIVTIAAGG